MVVVTRTCKKGQSSMVEGGLMARFGRWAGWGDATFAVRAVPVEAKSENDAVASVYLEKYGRFTDAEQHGQAMAESAKELFDDARRGSVYQLLRLEPVP